MIFIAGVVPSFECNVSQVIAEIADLELNIKYKICIDLYQDQREVLLQYAYYSGLG